MNLSGYTTITQFEGKSSQGMHNYRSWVPVGITGAPPTLWVKFLVSIFSDLDQCLKRINPKKEFMDLSTRGFLKQTRL
jgi:hypothetical protein